MAKKTYKILRFDGGINNNSDPRDIGDNQFADLQNVAVDEMGKLVVLGDIKTTAVTVGGSPDITGKGNGVFAVSTDYTGLLDDTVATASTTYYLVEKTDAITGEASDGEGPNDIACPMNQASMFFINNGLRIAEADLTSGNITPKWRGYIPAKTYGASGTDVDAYNTGSTSPIWSTQDMEIKGAFPEVAIHASSSDGGDLVAVNAIVVNTQDDSKVQGSNIVSGFCFDQTLGGKCTTGTGAAAAADNVASGMNWGIALAYDSGANGTGSWTPVTGTTYRFYITTMYDDNTQESLPQIMTHWDEHLLSTDASYKGTPSQYATSQINFANGDNHNLTTGHMIAQYFHLRLKLQNATSETSYNYGGSTVGATSGGNSRITGNRIYWSSSEDGFSELWMLFDIDFEKGVKPIGLSGASNSIDGYAPWEEYDQQDQDGSASSVAKYNQPKFTDGFVNKWVNPPRILQYSVLNGHFVDDTIKIDAFKASCIANRRVYLGNIKQKGEVYGDRMIKSPVGQFDKFPMDANNIDVAINDGDEIVHLVEFADRILQFKKNVCYVINVGGASEFLEQELRFKGISNPGASCRTDYGVAWVNNHGCFLYDGNQVTDLLEEKGLVKIKKSTWSSFIGTANHHRVGFNPFKRQLIVKEGNSGNAAYLYDMVTKSWTYSSSMIVDADTGSPFINDPSDGSLMIFDDDGNTFDKWTDTPTSNPAINIVTKDIDFGEPAIRKKIYKVYITYKSNSSSLPALTYDTDGNTGLAHPTTPVTAFTNTSNQWTVAEYTFGSDTNNCKSIQLKINGTVDTNFEINDISFIYRSKTIK